jgi:hypothetical protein
MIVIEDRFADVVITDEDVDEIEVVGDLIRHIEGVDNERRRRSARFAVWIFNGDSECGAVIGPSKRELSHPRFVKMENRD